VVFLETADSLYCEATGTLKAESGSAVIKRGC